MRRLINLDEVHNSCLALFIRFPSSFSVGIHCAHAVPDERASDTGLRDNAGKAYLCMYSITLGTGCSRNRDHGALSSTTHMS